MAIFDEKIIKVTNYELLEKLPDPFLKKDGERVNTPEDFEEHKSELYKSAIELQYGTMPPKPEFLEVETLYLSPNSSSYRIITGRRDHPVYFTIRVYRPSTKEKCPVVIDGDLCFEYTLDKEFQNAMLSENIGFVVFNRTELVHDICHEGRKGQLYECYPEYTFGALGAWAWGYSRVVDALEILGFFDNEWIAFTGHSRGGKTAMLAGILDKRARIIMPNESGAGGCGCYRVHINALTEDGAESRNETLADLWRNFDFWVGPEMENYLQSEEKLPFDEHYLKALVCPRTLVLGEAASDIWANPVGSYMTTKAAEEVYKLYGKSENLYWYYRYGYHAHKTEDIKMLVSVIKHQKEGRELCDGFYSIPFEAPEMAFDWKCPDKE